jgi:hypothetical protein
MTLNTVHEDQLLQDEIANRLQTINPTLKRKFVAQIRREIAQSFQDEAEMYNDDETEDLQCGLKSKKGKYEINELEKKTTNTNSNTVSLEPVEISEERMAVDSIANNSTNARTGIGSEHRKDNSSCSPCAVFIDLSML